MSYLSAHKLPAGHAMTGHFMQNLPVVNAIGGSCQTDQADVRLAPINQNKARSYDGYFVITACFILILPVLLLILM